MRRWSRWAGVCVAASMSLAAVGCGQLFKVKSMSSQPTLEELSQRVDQLEAQVSELNAAVAGVAPNGGQASTPSGAATGSAATDSGATGSGSLGSGAADSGATGGGAGTAATQASGQSSTGIQAVVTADYLNVHPQPDVSSPRVGVVKHDTAVTVVGAQGDWTEIQFMSLKGWVESKFLQKTQ